MKNHFDKNGNYINIENLSLAEIYHRGYQDGSEDGLNDIRPHGKWILCDDTYFSKCSICGDIWLNEECGNYCSNCGADMRGEKK